MKSIRLRSIVVYILAIIFLFGILLFVVNIFINGNVWATSSVNNHIAQVGSLSMAGKIKDRNDTVLSETVNNQRVYNSDVSIRKATLHTVGDDTKFISSAIQNSYRADLIGYNFITGLTTAGLFGYGNDITLTIDSELCSQAYSLFNGRKGAAVVYNYKTGEILCMFSSPTYDPNDPPDYDDIKDDSDYDGVYLNKCLSASLMPGSVFKVVTSTAAIDNIDNIYSKTFHCDGSLKIGDTEITCEEAHGDISFREAMSQSCNIAFAQITQEIGKDKMTETANQMGFNQSFCVDTTILEKSCYDVENATQGQFAWSGSGQYTDTLNPMHMAMIMGAVANNGIAVTPYTVEKITTPVMYNNYVGYATAQKRFISAETAKELKDLMRYTVKTHYGDNLFPELEVCAKTGTAEVGEDKKPNGWMVGFSERNDCPLAFAVVVENSGYGISTAGPIAEALMKSASDKMIK